MKSIFTESGLGRLKSVCFFSALFSLLAHGYRYLSLSFSGDSMLIAQPGEELYQISLGRFLQPVYWQIRGYITAPLLIGLFATAFLIVCAAIVIDLLELRRPLHIALACAILSTNETFAASNATYLPWTDVYMLAMAFALLGVYAFFRMKHGWLLSPLLYCLSVGLYQSYLPTASALIILVLMLHTLKGSRASMLFGQGVRACVSLVLGLLLYALALSLVLRFAGVAASNDYNGVGQVGSMSLSVVPHLLVETYVTPLVFLFDLSGKSVMTWHVSAVPQLLSIAIFALSGVMLLIRARRLPPASLALLLFLVLVLPLGVNFIQFIARGTVSGLTIFAYYFLYLIPLMPLAMDGACPHLFRAAASAAVLLFALLICVNIRNSNTMAVKRDLEYASTTSAMTRLLDEAEQTEGYIPGETPVVLISMLPSSAISMTRPGFEDISLVQGMRYTYGASYETANYWYLTMALGEPVNLVNHEERKALTENTDTSDMPAFPREGCCRMIDGRLFIKISP